MKTSNFKKRLPVRFLALFLAVLMTMSTVPLNATITAFAADIEDYTFTVTDSSTPLEDATVKVFDINDTLVGSQITNATGVALFENELDDETEYSFVVSKLGYADFDGTTIDFTNNPLNTDVEMTALETLTISGTVTDGTNPIDGATVSLSGYSSANTNTLAGGTFSFANVYAGQNYTLTVAKDGYITQAVIADLENNNDNDIELAAKVLQPDLAFADNGPVDVKFETAYTNEATGDVGDGAVVYTSSNSSIATVADGGVITAIAVGGPVTITATKEETDNYLETSITYLLTVTSGDQASFDFKITAPAPIVYGDTTFTNKATGGSGDGTVTYASSDEGIATVGSDGILTTVKAGTVTITATKAGGTLYEDATATYEIEILHADQAPLVFANTDPDDIFVDEVDYINLASGGSLDGSISYAVTAGDSATVDSTSGKLADLQYGDVTITATLAGNDCYNDVTVSYDIHIKRILQPAPFDWNKTESEPFTLVYGNNSYQNTASGGSGTGAIVYSSSDSTIVTVDANGTLVPVKAGGPVTITATKEKDAIYEANEVSYSVTIARADQVLTFTNDSPENIVYGATMTNTASGSGTGAVTYEVIAGTDVAAVDSNTGEITLKKSGEITVRATIAECEKYNTATKDYTLTILKAEQSLTFANGLAPVITYDPDIVYSNSVTAQSEETKTYSVVSGEDCISDFISAEGTFKLVKAGTVVIQVTVDTDDKYKVATAQYSLTVNRAEQTGFAFVNSGPVDIVYGKDNSYQNDASGGESTGVITYAVTSGTNAQIADNENSEVTILAQGDGIEITATKAEDDRYLAITDTYILNVKYADEPDAPCSLTGKKNSATNWFTGDVTVLPKAGYQISTSDSLLTTNWSDKLENIVTDEGKTTVTYYLKSADGITSQLSVTAFKDSTKPTIELSVGTWGPWADILEILTFGLWSPSSKTVTIVSGDVIDETQTSGVETVQYYISSDTDIISKEQLDTIENWSDYTESFDIAAESQNVIYVKATDTAGNVQYACSDGIILDSVAPVAVLTPGLSNESVTFVNGIYNGDINVKVDVTDASPYSGISQVEYKVYKDFSNYDNYTDGTITQEDTLYTFAPLNSEAILYNELVGQWSTADEGSKKIVVSAADNNSDKVAVEVTVTDNAGNVATYSIPLKIDATKPQIVVSYLNEVPATMHQEIIGEGGYFAVTRQAQVVITERTSNFVEVAKKINTEFDGEGIEITATDLAGNMVTEFTADKISTWSTIEGDTPDEAIHTAYIDYDVDARYTFAVAYTDRAGNANDGVTIADEADAPYEFTVDRVNPSGLNIAYESNPFIEWANAITFGYFFNDTVEVTVSALDETAGLETINYSYDVQLDTSSVNVGGSGEFNDADNQLTLSGSNHSASFNIEPQFKGKVTMTATDKAGWVTNLTGEGITVDNTSPVLDDDVQYDTIQRIVDKTSLITTSEGPAYPIPANSIVCFEDTITATVKIDDANFYPEDMTGENTVWSDLNTSATGSNDNGIWVTDVTDGLPGVVTRKVVTDWTQDGDVWTGTTTISGEGDYLVTMKYTDRSGSVMADYTSEQLTIDSSVPVITLGYSNNDIKGTFADNISGEDRGYFVANRTATITIDEHTFRADEVEASVTASDCFSPDANNIENAFKVKNQNGDYITIGSDDYDTFLSNRDYWTSDGDIHTAEIVYDVDANFTFEISYTDILAFENEGVTLDEETQAPYIFTVDKVNPSGLNISYESNPFVEWLNTATFGLFFKNTVTVTVSAVDETAGLEKIDYSYDVIAGSSVANVGGTDVFNAVDDELILDGYNHTASFDIPAQFKGMVTITATDKAARVTALTGEGITVDDVAPILADNIKYDTIKRIVDKTSLITTSEGPAYPIPANSIVCFEDTITATVMIDDANFYPEDMTGENTTWNELNTSAAGSNDNGIWVTDVTNGLPGVVTRKVVTDWTQNGDVWTGTTTISGEGDYVVSMKYTDRSGNVMADYTSEQLTIDTTDPTIMIGYSNNDTKGTFEDKETGENRGYFDANRTATITIVEHNFRADDVVAVVDAKDCFSPDAQEVVAVDTVVKYSNYLQTRGNWIPVDGAIDTYRAEVPFDVDANYTFEISYTDLAKRQNQGISLETGTEAPYLFTVDKVNPSGLNIAYESEAYIDWLNTITFGLFFKDTVKVTVSAVDMTAGLEKIEYWYDVEDGSSVDNEGGQGVFNATDNDLTLDEYNHTASFNIPAQFKGKVTINATDKAGRENDPTAEGITGEGITVDNVAPILADYVKYEPITRIVDKTSLFTTSEGPTYPIPANSIVYFDNTITATVKIDDANFYPEDMTGEDTEWQELNTSATGRNDNGIWVADVTNGLPGVVTRKVVTDWTQNGDVWTGTTTISGEGDYVVTMKYTDRSGNKMLDYTSEQLTIDTTVPEITLAYDNNDVANEKFFKAEREATITIKEHNFRADDVIATVTAINADNGNVDVGDYTTTLNNRENWYAVNGEADTYQAVINYISDANYTFEIKYQDLATNWNYIIDDEPSNPEVWKTGIELNEGTKAPYEFTIDKVAPTGFVKVAEWLASVDAEKTVWDMFLDNIIYGLWSNESVSVDIVSQDELSGIEKIEHFRTPNAMTLNDVEAADGWIIEQNPNDVQNLLQPWSLGYAIDQYSVAPNEQFIVYSRITDIAHNVTYISSDGIIVDDEAPDIEMVAPEVEFKVEYPEITGGIYAGDVKVTVTITDPTVGATYSGLNNWNWEVLMDGVVDPQKDSWTFAEDYPTQGQLVQTVTREILINSEKYNSNEIDIRVYAEDNSRNSITKLYSEDADAQGDANGFIKIDITPPEITVLFDEEKANKPQPENEDLYKSPRSATVYIKERNFDPKDVNITITRKDDSETTVTVPYNDLTWVEHVAASGNGDNHERKFTIYFGSTADPSLDGDYEFGISYVDQAGNPNKPTDYGNSVMPVEKFTVDTVAPVVNVYFKNNDAKNENYFKSKRTVTIEVEEHNFGENNINFVDDVKSVVGEYGLKIQLKATDREVAVPNPSVSWVKTEGNIRTLSIVFEADALYTFDVSFTDLAGNDNMPVNYNEAVSPNTFYVDKAKPTLVFKSDAAMSKPLADKSAYKDETIGFTLIAEDTNLDVYAPELTAVTRKTDGTFDTAKTGSVTEKADRRGAFETENINEDGIYMLVCNVEDKAGNICDEIEIIGSDGIKTYSTGDRLIIFSVNREGSTFYLDDGTVGFTTNLYEKYWVQNVDSDVIITEINVNQLQSYEINVNDAQIEKNTQYQVSESGSENTWWAYTYTIKKALFEAEKMYKIKTTSTNIVNDVENLAFSDLSGAFLEFVVDRTPPEVTISGIKTLGRYATDKQTVTLQAKDDGGRLSSLKVEIRDQDNKDIKLKDKDGKDTEWSGEDVGTQQSFVIPESSKVKYNVQVVCTDMAQNSSGETNQYDETFSEITVSTNKFILYLANKPLFYGSIGGVLALGMGVATLVIIKKRKSKSGQ